MHAELLGGQAEAARFGMHRGDDQNAAAGKYRRFVAFEDPVARVVLLRNPENAAAAGELDGRLVMDRRDRSGRHVHRDRAGAVDDVLVHRVLKVDTPLIKGPDFDQP